MTKSAIALLGAIAGVAAVDNALWRMECPSRVGLARLDPIINPGEMSKHVHAIHGSGGFSETAGTADLLASDCTSCRVTQDKSSYWHPALYFKDDDTGDYELVNQVGGMLAYYFLNGENITAFPDDFRMISGTNDKRTYDAGDPSEPDPDKSQWASLGQTDQDTLAERALGFNCLDYSKQPPEPTLYRHFLPEKDYLDDNCLDGVRFELMFPSCWKGGDALDSDNHKDHVAFPDLVMNGNCPEGYDVRLPGLMYEVIWDTYAFKDKNGRFVIANGDTTGFGYHGDFIMGWEDDVLQEAVDQCENPSGLIEDCPVFNVVSKEIAAECSMKLPSALANEKVDGPFALLPGGDEMTGGDDSTGGSDGGDSSVAPTSEAATPAPTLDYTPGDTATDPAAALPGVFKETTSAFVAPAPTTSSTTLQTSTTLPDVAALEVPTVPAPQPTTTSTAVVTSAPSSESISYFSTQYVTNGEVVSEILWEEEVVYVTQYDDTTTTVVVPAPTGMRHRRGAHLHGHGHRHL